MALHLMQDQPWHKIRTFGNVLRHEYDEIREDKLFEIVKSDLPGLHVEAVEALRRWNWSTNHSCEQSGTSASCAAFYPVSR